MKKYTERELRETLGQELQASEQVNERLAEVYDEIRTGKVKRHPACRRWYGAAGTAAAVFAAGVFCVSNPVLAAKLPVIGRIFEELQGRVGFPGDYSEVGEQLEDDGAADSEQTPEGGMDEASQYTQTADGLTVTLSEVYCNDQALYVAMQMKSDEPLTESDGFQCYTTEQYSFNPTQQQDVSDVDGEFVDENTYVGVLRFDLNNKTTDLSEYEAAREEALAAGEEWDDSTGVDAENENWEKYAKTVEIPDEFTLDLTLDEIVGALVNPEKPDYGKTQEEIDAMSDEEWHAYITEWTAQHPDWSWENEHQYAVFNGPWSFTLDVKKRTDDTQTVVLNDVNAQGIGMEKVEKDRFEITMYDTYADEADRADYIAVMLDADGQLMGTGGGTPNTVAIGSHDVSHVDVFLVDYMKWMDELKGDCLPGENETDGQSVRETLLAQSAYHVEVQFDEKGEVQ